MSATAGQINKHIWEHVGSLTCLTVCQDPSLAGKSASHPGSSPGANTNAVTLQAGGTGSRDGTADSEENPSRCQLLSQKRPRKDKRTPAIVCK